MLLVVDEVHICCIGLDDFASQVQTFYQQLTIDEKRRAERYNFTSDKKRFITVRGVLRQIISNYLNVDPERIEFNYSHHGKSVLTNIYSDTDLRFNVSHSGELAMFVFALDREVGVDIEYIREIPEMEQIVDHFFTDTEKIRFYKLSKDIRKKVFFQIWTRKEALLKAIGKGLYLSLDAFDVFSSPGKPINILNQDINHISDKTSSWYVKDINPHACFAAAYAVEGHVSHRWIHWRV